MVLFIIQSKFEPNDIKFVHKHKYLLILKKKIDRNNREYIPNNTKKKTI